MTRSSRSRELKSALAAMSTEHIACRDYGHSWMAFSAQWKSKERVYVSQLRCSRCTTIRERLLNRTGAQISNHYHYSEGYLVKGLGRLTGVDRDAVRLASVQEQISRKGDDA